MCLAVVLDRYAPHLVRVRIWVRVRVRARVRVGVRVRARVRDRVRVRVRVRVGVRVRARVGVRARARVRVTRSPMSREREKSPRRATHSGSCAHPSSRSASDTSSCGFEAVCPPRGGRRAAHQAPGRANWEACSGASTCMVN